MREKVILICSNCLSRNYNTFKSSLGKKERLELKKFCSTCNGHILHKETR